MDGRGIEGDTEGLPILDTLRLAQRTGWVTRHDKNVTVCPLPQKGAESLFMVTVSV